MLNDRGILYCFQRAKLSKYASLNALQSMIAECFIRLKSERTEQSDCNYSNADELDIGNNRLPKFIMSIMPTAFGPITDLSCINTSP